MLPIFSTSFILAARTLIPDKKNQCEFFEIPKIDLKYSDDIELAKQRFDLAIDTATIFKDYYQSCSSIRAPNQAEFDLIAKLYQATDPDAYTTMEQTRADATIILHNDSPNTHKRIFGGQLLRACLEVSWLSVLELCEIS